MLKSKALQQRKDYEDATAVYKAVLTIEPTNNACLQQINLCRERLKKEREQERKRFAGLFEKLATPAKKEAPSSANVPANNTDAAKMKSAA